MMKQRLTSSVSIFFTSPYLTIRINPRAAIPTKTIDQPIISHLKKSDKENPLNPKKTGEEVSSILCPLTHLSRFDGTGHVPVKCEASRPPRQNGTSMPGLRGHAVASRLPAKGIPFISCRRLSHFNGTKPLASQNPNGRLMSTELLFDVLSDDIWALNLI